MVFCKVWCFVWYGLYNVLYILWYVLYEWYCVYNMVCMVWFIGAQDVRYDMYVTLLYVWYGIILYFALGVLYV